MSRMRTPGSRAMIASFDFGESAAPLEERHDERREVAGTGVHGVDEGGGEGLAGDRQKADPLTLDRVEHVAGVETVDDALDDDRPSGVQRLEAHPLPGAVHEGRRRQAAGPRPGGGRLHELGERVPLVTALAEVAAPECGDEDVTLPPQDALRLARRSARVEDIEVVGRPLERRAHRAAAARADS